MMMMMMMIIANIIICCSLDNCLLHPISEIGDEDWKADEQVEYSLRQ